MPNNLLFWNNYFIQYMSEGARLEKVYSQPVLLIDFQLDGRGVTMSGTWP